MNFKSSYVNNIYRSSDDKKYRTINKRSKQTIKGFKLFKIVLNALCGSKKI